MILEEKVKLAINQDEKAFEYLMNISKEGLYRIAFAYAKMNKMHWTYYKKQYTKLIFLYIS
ncbi:hypothetical protein [Clostridium ljungdahlii]|uniref:hypothetical protein n=1 Tax=Clostridium ljungdahlii TaxID=1538 RepID=UPI00386E8D63